MGEKWSVKWEIFEKILCDFWVKFCVIFKNIVLLANRTDASEISRSLSNESVNIGPFCHNLVKVHLTKLYTGIGSK